MGPLEFLGLSFVDTSPGMASANRREAIDATRRGLPVSGIENLVSSGRLTIAEIDRVILPRKTLSHRRKMGR